MAVIPYPGPPWLSPLSLLGKPYHSPRTKARDDRSANYALLGPHNWARICITVALQPGLVISAISQPTPLRIPIDAQFGALRLGLLRSVWSDVRAIYWCLLVHVSALFG